MRLARKSLVGCRLRPLALQRIGHGSGPFTRRSFRVGVFAFLLIALRPVAHLVRARFRRGQLYTGSSRLDRPIAIACWQSAPRVSLVSRVRSLRERILRPAWMAIYPRVRPAGPVWLHFLQAFQPSWSAPAIHEPVLRRSLTLATHLPEFFAAGIFCLVSWFNTHLRATDLPRHCHGGF
jgi:hypothetical protein